MYLNKIENRITLELLTREAIKSFGISKSKITKDKIGENVPHLETIEVVVLGHCKIVNNDYQQDSRVLYTFVPNKLLGQLLDILLYFAFA